jgi:hypothetical protein
MCSGRPGFLSRIASVFGHPVRGMPGAQVTGGPPNRSAGCSASCWRNSGKSLFRERRAPALHFHFSRAEPVSAVPGTYQSSVRQNSISVFSNVSLPKRRRTVFSRPVGTSRSSSSNLPSNSSGQPCRRRETRFGFNGCSGLMVVVINTEALFQHANYLFLLRMKIKPTLSSLLTGHSSRLSAEKSKPNWSPFLFIPQPPPANRPRRPGSARPESAARCRFQGYAAPALSGRPTPTKNPSRVHRTTSQQAQG